jgi:hypothetical protein
MGGRALKNTYIRRYTREEFDSVSKELVDIIEKIFDKAAIPLFYHEKETFGDIDIIVNIDDAWGGQCDGGFIREYIEGTFKPNEIYHNGNCYSFDYKEVQVDFMCVKGEDFDSNFHYLAYNDLGNYISRIAHRLGLKYGQEGLWYNHYINDQNKGRVMVSKNYEKIFKFLDLDYQRWLKGFDKLEDTFKYVTTSKYFDTDMFQLDNLNRVNRERNLKRTSYMSFIDWINTKYEHKIGAKLEGDLFKVVEANFPESGFMGQIKKIEYEVAKKACVNAKFNGGIIMRRYGLEGKALGDSLKKFKRVIESMTFKFDDFIINASQEEIFELFENVNELEIVF